MLGISSLWRAGERRGTLSRSPCIVVDGTLTRICIFSSGVHTEPTPLSHRNFSHLEFALAGDSLIEIAQEDEATPDLPPPQREDRPLAEESITGSYLSDDDIEEW